MFTEGVGKGYAPDVPRLVHWSNWITPAIESKRFNTHFFLAVLPYPAGRAHTKFTAADGKETVSVQWVTPKEVITQFKEGKIRMFPPQYYTLLDLMNNYPTLSHLSAFADGAKSRTLFERIPSCPEAKPSPDGRMMLVLPGDELHSAEGLVTVGSEQVKVEKAGGRNRSYIRRDKSGINDITVERNVPRSWMSWGEGLDDGRKSVVPTIRAVLVTSQSDTIKIESVGRALVSRFVDTDEKAGGLLEYAEEILASGLMKYIMTTPVVREDFIPELIVDAVDLLQKEYFINWCSPFTAKLIAAVPLSFASGAAKFVMTMASETPRTSTTGSRSSKMLAIMLARLLDWMRYPFGAGVGRWAVIIGEAMVEAGLVEEIGAVGGGCVRKDASRVLEFFFRQAMPSIIEKERNFTQMLEAAVNDCLKMSFAGRLDDDIRRLLILSKYYALAYPETDASRDLRELFESIAVMMALFASRGFRDEVLTRFEEPPRREAVTGGKRDRNEGKDGSCTWALQRCWAVAACGKCGVGGEAVDPIEVLEEPFLDLVVPIPGTKDSDPGLTEMLEQMALPEELSGDNMYYCDKCNERRDATRVTRVSEAPPYLIIALNRFSYSRELLKRVKIDTKVNYPLKLLLQTLSEGRDTLDPVSYSLYAVVFHSGASAEYGHYYTFVREEPPAVDSSSTNIPGSSTGDSQTRTQTSPTWTELNDTAIQRHLTSSHLLTIAKNHETPYVFFYRRSDRDLLDDFDDPDNPVFLTPRLLEYVKAADIERGRRKQVRFDDSSRWRANPSKSYGRSAFDIHDRYRSDRDEDDEYGGGGLGSDSYSNSWLGGARYIS
ncbi:hypothetical protein HDU93_009729 [Gonapodya sp. JEL0774]|nr:hypothetical protein HDU93_009729 [Gonapodya sp. JEL0774]